MTDTKYNGWTNYETWNTNLHFDDSFTEEAQEFYDDAKADDTFTREENAAFALAKRIKETVEEITCEGMDSSRPFISDIINGFLSSVNYHEIAKHYIEECDKEESEAA